MEKNYPSFDVKRWVKYLEYKFTDIENDTTGEYRIRFYIDSNNKVTEIMYIKDYAKF